MNIEKAIEIICYELKRPYCDNCKHNVLRPSGISSVCEDCHRKYISWQISEGKAKHIAEQILAD